LPHEKPRHGFAFGSSQRNRMTLMFGAARCWRPGLSASRSFEFRLTLRGICGAGVSPHAAQVLQATMDFEACESARRAMRIKRLKCRAFSLSSARRKPHLAFSSPQRA
jgi:hypothetical protein